MRLLLDEMIGPSVAAALCAQGLDVDAVVERADLRALPDDQVLEHAHREGRVLVTRNVGEFARLSRTHDHAGLLMVTERAFPQNRNLVGALVTALGHAFDRDLLPGSGHVLYLSPP